MLGQLAPRMVAQLTHRNRCRVGHEVGNEHAWHRRCVLRDGDGLTHPGVVEQHPVDLGRLDAQTADLHLTVCATAELDRAVPAEPHHVAAGVQALIANPTVPARTSAR